jgi:hypothetical protein
LPDVNSGNYEFYYKDDDIYRQKILESYGYTFLRINKFNLWLKDNPAQVISDRLEELLVSITGKKWSHDSVIQEILDDVEKYKNGKKKVCPKCWELKDLENFYDSSLVSWEGRHCYDCKWTLVSEKKEKTNNENQQQLAEEKKQIIQNAINKKWKVMIFYKWSWEEILPKEMWLMSYMNHIYYWVIWETERWIERHYSLAKMTDVKAV